MNLSSSMSEFWVINGFLPSIELLYRLILGGKPSSSNYLPLLQKMAQGLDNKCQGDGRVRQCPVESRGRESQSSSMSNFYLKSRWLRSGVV
jgi:hypothetical protein